MENFKSAQIDLPENDDEMGCPECFDGTMKDGGECTYCEGYEVISERYYNMVKDLERDEQDL